MKKSSTTLLRLLCLSCLFVAGLMTPAYAENVPVDFVPTPISVRSYRYSTYQKGISISFNLNGKKPFSEFDPKLIECTPAPKKPVAIARDWDSTYIILADFEPGTHFDITLKAGFPGKSSDCQLPADYIISGHTPDLPSKASIASTGMFFPLHAPIWELPISSVNYQKKIPIRVYELYPSTLLNALRSFEEYSAADRWARLISQTEIQVPAPKNQTAFSSLSLADIGIPRNRPGAYIISFNDQDDWYYDSSDTRKIIVVTDLAIFATVQNGEYLCQVRSLAHPEQPVPGVKLVLWSRKNQELATGTTDANGEARLQLPLMDDRTDYPMVLLANNPQNNDCAYLDFETIGTDSRFQERQTGQTASQVAAYLFADRGAVIPGEEVTFTAFLQNPQENRPLAGMPLEVKLYDSRNHFVSGQVTTTDPFGILQTTFRLAEEASLGNYEVRLVQPGTNLPYSSTTFLVANFTPDQFTARTTLPDGFSVDAESLPVELQADYYFGAPVRNAPVEALLTSRFLAITPPRELKEFSFGPSQLPASENSSGLTKGKTDEQGHLELKLNRPYANRDQVTTVLPLLLTAQATVKPVGVRAVTARTTRRIDLFDCYLGSRIARREDSRIQLQFAAIDPQSHPAKVPDGLKITLAKLTWDYLLKQQSDGTYRRTWELVKNELPSEPCEIDGEGYVWLELPGHGNFEVTVRDAEGRTLNQFSFWFYSGESEERSPNPNRLDFRFDQEKYLPGQIARVSYETDFDGTCLVVAGSHHTPMLTIAQPVKAGENTLEIKIPENLTQTSWFVGVTAVGNVTADASGKPADPQHLSGVARLPVDQSDRQLNATLDVPELARPGKTVPVKLTLKDSSGKPVVGEAVVWGVDEGILALTGYPTPDVFQAFYSNQDCPFAQTDFYRLLYPMLRVVNGKIGGGLAADVGGFNASAEFQGKLQENDESPHYFQLGILKTAADGTVTSQLALPQFAGRLRLMAVATDETSRLASTQQAMTMHDPVTLAFAAPRIIAPGDRMLLRGVIINQELNHAHLTWSFGRDLPGFQPGTGEVTIEKGDSAEVSFALAVPADTAEGPLPIHFTVTTDDGEVFTKKMVMTVRSHVPPQPVCETTVLKPGEELSVTLTGKATNFLRVGSPVTRLLRHWSWLNDYPYGCVEQITAQAFPQLAVPELIATGRLPETARAGAAQRVKDTLAKFHSYSAGNGWYTMWPNNSGPVWREGSIFAFLFQAEAERLGYFTMDSDLRESRINTLRVFINDQTNPQEERAVALYTLALLAPTFVQPYATRLADSTEECRPYTAFLCAMALIRSGFAAEGAQLWASVTDEQFTLLNADSTTIDSPVRRTGLALWLLADLLPEDPMLPKLAIALDDLAASDLYFTTQEHAWYALGLAKYLLTLPKITGDSTFAATLTDADGRDTSLQCAGEQPATYSKSGSYIIRNTGSEPLVVQHSYRKVSSEILPAANGLHISRIYQNAGGEIVSSCKVGDLLTVKIILVGANSTNLVLSDLLPAGFEIEDENLLTRATAGTSMKQSADNTMYATLVEKRFDRLLWFGNLREHGEFTYQVRAVAPGVFQVPPIQIEAMYKPQLRAVGAPSSPVFTITEE